MAETSTTMPSDVGTISTTTTTDNVTSLSPDVVIEMSPSSNANQVDKEAVEKAAVDSVNMETASSSDLPREAIDSATEETSHSKMKLQRQDAVAEEKDETPLEPAVVSSQPLGKIFDDITTSLSGLTIGNVLYMLVYVWLELELQQLQCDNPNPLLEL